MHTELCDRFGIAYPIFVFTPSEKVAAAVSRAGGLGMLGCVRFNDARELEKVLCWMDENTGGKPYGVDIVMPAKIPAEGTSLDLAKLIPEAHKSFVDRTLRELAVPPLPVGALRDDDDPAADFEAQKAFTPWTSAWNVTGMPAVSLPVHWTPFGLPVGVMLAARPAEEELLLSLAAQVEAAAPWSERHPPGW